MTDKNSKKYRWFFISPALFAIYPVLYVFAYNQQELVLKVLPLPLLVFEIAVWIIWLVVFVILKNIKQTSFIVALSAILFFSFNFIRTVTLNIEFISYDLRNLIILSAYALFPLIFFLGIYISDKKLIKINNFLNITAIILCVFSIFSIASYQIKTKSNNESLSIATHTTVIPEILPDIYYIITDAHARSDILEEIYDIDNSDFINFLKDKGFYVAEESYTNYPVTLFSLSSSLNMEYHEGYDRKSADVGPVIQKIHNSVFKKMLEKLEYEVYAFATGTSGTEMRSADYYLGPKGVLNEFHMALFKMTPLPNSPIRLINYIIFNSHRSRILYTFDNLPEVARAEGPKFVIAHIVAPHFPFVFNSDGSPISNEISFVLHSSTFHDPTKPNIRRQDEYIKYYGEQLKFVDLKLKETIAGILENATRPSIIVLQADHGPASHYYYNSLEGSYLKERFAILNAYYFFDKNYDNLYQSISPVNTFRVISNQYFDKDYELLEDKSFNLTKQFPYYFVDITDQREEMLVK